MALGIKWVEGGYLGVVYVLDKLLRFIRIKYMITIKMSAAIV